MRELRSQIDINTSAETVWQILIDFPAYPTWNPFIRRISGKAEVGERLKVYLQPPRARGMEFRPTVLSVVSNRELRWLGKLWIKGLFDGEHSFTIEQLDENHVRLTQQEQFSGLLVPFTGGILRETLRGFEEMNRALKERAERRSGG
ncbi:MAG: SRPBCC family protein [Candidatus Aquicultor sp.]